MFPFVSHTIFKSTRDSSRKDRKSDREVLLQLDYDYPVSTKDYSKLEWKNTININVFGYENKEFYPFEVSKEHNKDVLNLLLITKDEKRHYVLIKDFNKLMFNKTKHKGRKYFCMHCLKCCSSQDILTKHKTNCMVINAEQAIRMPQKSKNTLQFQNFHKQMPEPFVIYADFEKIQGCQPNDIQSYLIIIPRGRVGCEMIDSQRGA